MEYTTPSFEPPYRVLVLAASTDGWYAASDDDRASALDGSHDCWSASVRTARGWSDRSTTISSRPASRVAAVLDLRALRRGRPRRDRADGPRAPHLRARPHASARGAHRPTALPARELGGFVSGRGARRRRDTGRRPPGWRGARGPGPRTGSARCRGRSRGARSRVRVVRSAPPSGSPLRAALICPILSKIASTAIGRESGRGLVEQQDVWLRHQRPREREHLPLPAGERPR